MKNSTHQVLYAILFSALGFLLFLQFSNSDRKIENSENNEVIQSQLIVNRDSGNILNIAYNFLLEALFLKLCHKLTQRNISHNEL